MRASVTLLSSVVPALDAATPNQPLRFMLAVREIERDATPDAPGFGYSPPRSSALAASARAMRSVTAGPMTGGSVSRQ